MELGAIELKKDSERMYGSCGWSNQKLFFFHLTQNEASQYCSFFFFFFSFSGLFLLVLNVFCSVSIVASGPVSFKMKYESPPSCKDFPLLLFSHHSKKKN